MFWLHRSQPDQAWFICKHRLLWTNGKCRNTIPINEAAVFWARVYSKFVLVVFYVVITILPVAALFTLAQERINAKVFGRTSHCLCNWVYAGVIFFGIFIGFINSWRGFLFLPAAAFLPTIYFKSGGSLMFFWPPFCLGMTVRLLRMVFFVNHTCSQWMQRNKEKTN